MPDDGEGGELFTPGKQLAVVVVAAGLPGRLANGRPAVPAYFF
jgi:hypothetical protein